MAIDVGADLPAGPNPADFNRAASDFEASVGLSTQTLMTWSQQLELSISSVNRFSQAIDQATRNLGHMQGPGMSSSAAQMSPAMVQTMSSAMGTAMANIMSSPMARGMQSGQQMWSGARNATTAGLGNSGDTVRGVANAGRGMQGVGAAVGGRAGGVLAGAGGALTKAAGPIGVAIQVIQGIWATLKAIEAIQAQVQKEQRSSLMAGPAQAGTAYGSDPDTIQSMNQNIKSQERMNKFTSREVQEGMMRDLMSTQKDMGSLQGFLQPQSMKERGAEITDASVVGPLRRGARGVMGSSRNSMSAGSVEELQATGYSNEKIAGSIAGNVNTFGNFQQGGGKQAFGEAAAEIKELKLRSGALNISQTSYMRTQEDLISTNREQIRSVKDVRDEMVIFGKEVEAGLLSVKDFSDALRGPGSQTLDNTLAQMHLFGEEQATALEKEGRTKEASMIREARSMDNQFEAAAKFQEAMNMAGQGAGGGRALSAANMARVKGMGSMVGAESTGAQALMGSLSGMGGFNLMPGETGKARSFLQAQQQAPERFAQMEGGREGMEKKMNQTMETMTKNAHTMMDSMMEPLKRGVDTLKDVLNNTAQAVTRFGDAASQTGVKLKGSY